MHTKANEIRVCLFTRRNNDGKLSPGSVVMETISFAIGKLACKGAVSHKEEVVEKPIVWQNNVTTLIEEQKNK